MSWPLFFDSLLLKDTTSAVPLTEEFFAISIFAVLIESKATFSSAISSLKVGIFDSSISHNETFIFITNAISIVLPYGISIILPIFK